MTLSKEESIIQLNTEPGPIRVEASRTAVITVDMQNGFVSRGGYFDTIGVDIARTRKIIKPCREILDAARKCGFMVVYLQMADRPDPLDAAYISSPRFVKLQQKRRWPAKRPKLPECHYHQGTWGFQIIDELKPHPGDSIIVKHRHDGFIETDLHATLKSVNIKYLLFIGTATNICVESTLRHAFFLDYFSTIVSDAVSPMGPDVLQEATLANVKTTFGWSICSENLIVDLGRFTDLLNSKKG